MEIQLKSKKTRKEYNKPTIYMIQLDNQISLQLESEPSIPPDEVYNTQQKDPFYNA